MTCTIVSNGTELKLTCQNENEQPYPTIKVELDKILQSLYHEGYNEFWLTCERGIPLWAAERLCLMKSQYNMKLHIAVPYEEQTTDWVEEYRERYFKMHELADSIEFVNKHWNSECYRQTEEYMLNKSDLLFVFGTSADNLYTVGMAKAMGVNVRFIQ